MTKKEKETHIMKYDKEILNKEVAPRFYAHVEHFMKNDKEDDEVVAEILDFMYDVLISTANQGRKQDENSTLFP